MPDVAVLGAYDAEAPLVFDVDLMQYLTAVGRTPSAVIFKTSPSFHSKAPFNTVIRLGERRSAIRVRDFNDPAAVAAMSSLGADLFVYAGGRDLLGASVLRAARLGCIGGHYGVLPEVRGMGTVEWSVIAGHPIAVTIQRMSEGVDTGDVLMQSQVPLSGSDDFRTIRDRCYFVTKVLLSITARGLLNGTIQPVPQNLSDGRQYFRLHPALQSFAERRLAKLLAGLRASGPAPA